MKRAGAGRSLFTCIAGIVLVSILQVSNLAAASLTAEDAPAAARTQLGLRNDAAAPVGGLAGCLQAIPGKPEYRLPGSPGECLGDLRGVLLSRGQADGGGRLDRSRQGPPRPQPRSPCMFRHPGLQLTPCRTYLARAPRAWPPAAAAGIQKMWHDCTGQLAKPPCVNQLYTNDTSALLPHLKYNKPR
jgi:hypothetical protein